MANFDVKPQFDVAANMLQPTDPGHADLFNGHFGRLYNNDAYLKKEIEEVDTKAETAANIAKGRNQAHVFLTTEDMQAFLSNEDNKGVYNVGDNIYIVEVEVPDWWIAEVLEEVDADTGYYYKIAQLETQKVDLTEIENEIDTLNSNLASTLPLKGVLATTIDTTLDDGIYTMAGSGALGTFPNLVNAKYGIMYAVQRYGSCYQQLQCQGGIATREVGGDGTITDWVLCSFRREVHSVDSIDIVANGYVETTITFNYAFTDVPLVSVDLMGAGTRTLAQLVYVSASGCKVRLYTEDGKEQTGRGFRVIAMGF